MCIRRFRTRWYLTFVCTLLFCCFSFVSQAADWYVSTSGNDASAGTAANPFKTISRAVSQAVNGDVIHIGTGTFPEQVQVVAKSLTLIGDGPALTRIVAPAALSFSFNPGIPHFPLVHVQDAGNTVIKNLTVDGAGAFTNLTSAFVGISYLNAGGGVENCAIINILTTPPYSSDFGYGLFAFAGSGVARTVSVVNTRFTTFQKLAASFFGKDLTVNFENNTVEGAGLITQVAQNGVQFSQQATGTIKNNSLKNINYAAYDQSSTAILVDGARSGVTISGNNILDCQTGIYCLFTTGSIITQNTLKFSASNYSEDIQYWWGILVRGGTYTITQNEIDGGGSGTGIDGFAYANETTFITATNNIVKNVETGISLEVDENPACVGGEIHYNSITNALEPIYYLPGVNFPGDCPPPCVTCNWYGSANEGDFKPKFVGGNLFNYTPWLTSGIDTQPGVIGFQPASINGCSCDGKRDNFGCTPGYWKNCKDKSWTDAGYSRSNIFVTTFGITNYRGAVTASTTLQQALGLDGGEYKALARHGTAALLNAGHDHYPYLETEIKQAVKSMFNSGNASLPQVTVNGKKYLGKSFTSAEGLKNYLDVLNNAGCPINNAGNPEKSSRTMAGASDMEEVALLKEVAFISAYPNPSTKAFSIQVSGSGNEKVSLRITDIMGRVVEQRKGLQPNQVISVGEQYQKGLYYVEVTQGGKSQQLKLVKQ